MAKKKKSGILKFKGLRFKRKDGRGGVLVATPRRKFKKVSIGRIAKK